MKDIKFLGVDGDFLLLETSEGQRYRLVLDEAVRRASRGEPGVRLDSPTITPREIQEEIRAGRTVQDLIASSGAQEEYVLKFAQPVLDELNHAVLNALTVRLEVAGDRFNEPMAREFGEIIKSRLAASGASIERWSAMKAPDHGFFIYCDFEIDGIGKRGTWSYDPKRLSLRPENETATSLSSGDKLTSQAPRLRPVATEPTGITQNLADTVDLARSMSIVDQTPAGTGSDSDEFVMSETADLLEALRKKRSARQAVEDLEPPPATEGLRIVTIPVEEAYESENQEDSSTEQLGATSSPKVETDSTITVLEGIDPEVVEQPSSPRRGRASIPSWDEIVFGTKTED
jgi:hypothetical protein